MKEKSLIKNRVNSGKPKSKDKAILSQAFSTLKEGAETR